MAESSPYLVATGRAAARVGTRSAAGKVLTYSGAGVYEGVQVGVGLYDDIRHNSTRNTAENVFGVAAGAGGAASGAAAGAAYGTLVCPGVGTAVGGFIGATIGCVSADYLAREQVGKIFDKWGYEIKKYRCKSCKRHFKCRIYTDQSRRYCKRCIDEDSDSDY